MFLNQLAEGARQREMVRVNLDGTGDQNQVGLRGEQKLTDAIGELRRMRFEVPVRKAEELEDRLRAQHGDPATRLFFADLEVASLRSIRRDGDGDEARFTQMLGDEIPASA